MPSFDTPQDAEDAFYDALETGDPATVLATWEDSDEISCLFPMQMLAQGRGQVRAALDQLLGGGARKIELMVKHRQWIEGEDLALHLLEESAANASGQGQQAMAIYAVNVFRRSADGWRLLSHQNAPTPPPAELMAPMATGH